MFGRLTSFPGSLFDDFRRLEQEMDERFVRSSWPASIRSVAQGAYPPINVGAAPDRVNVYLFAAGLDPKSLDISLQRNLLTVSGERKVTVHEQANYYRQEIFVGLSPCRTMWIRTRWRLTTVMVSCRLPCSDTRRPGRARFRSSDQGLLTGSS
jgi:HSP20 family protein